MRSWLRTLRKEHKLTQAEAAAHMGISRQLYAFIECGTRQKNLTLNIAEKLGILFGLSLNEITELEKEYHQGGGTNEDINAGNQTA